MDTTNIIVHWIAHFFEAKLTGLRPGRDQMLEDEANLLTTRLRPRPIFWPQGLNITVWHYAWLLLHAFRTADC